METQGEMTTIRDTGKTEERAASLFHVRLGYTDVRNNGYMLPGSITIISFIVLYPGIESPSTVSLPEWYYSLMLQMPSTFPRMAGIVAACF